ncbi:MAG: hypothetical protein Q4C71_04270 [Microbacteriaceae bacterium]|nr:hypothetical protein [Microbacteriaceae bacterium]
MDGMQGRLRRVRASGAPFYLIATTLEHLSHVRLALETLPLCARGQIFVLDESGDFAAGRASLRVSPRMGVRVFKARERLVSALFCWGSEMLCSADMRVAVWFAGLPAEESRFLSEHSFECASLECCPGLTV